MEWVESTGRSLEDAKEAALDRLGVHEDDAEFDVLTEPRVGLFGRVKEDARVRARVRPTAPRAKDDRRRGRGRDRRPGSGGGGRGRGRRSDGAGGSGSGGKRSGRDGREGRDRSGSGGGEKTKSESGRDRGDRARRREGGNGGRGRGNGGDRGRGRQDGASSRGRQHGDDRGGDQAAPRSEQEQNKSQKREDPQQEDRSVSEQPAGPSLEEQAALAEEFVGGLAEMFGTSLTFERDDLEDEILRIEASGDDIGILVGRKGSTAQAIDDLVRTVLQRAGGTTREGKIRVDIGGVRARRAAALADFCRKVAGDVVDSGEEVALEPMGGADRKLVHDVVNDIDGVDTRSEGEDPHRRVVIVPAAGDS